MFYYSCVYPYSQSSMEPVSTAYSYYGRNETDEFRSHSDGNDVLRFIMTERGQLAKDDGLRFEKRQDSTTEFHTLENLKPVTVSYDPCVVPEPTDYDSQAIAASRREGNFEPDLEMLVDSAGSDMEDEETEFSKTVTSYIQDEKVRNSILAVNKQIDDNAVRYRREAEEAKAIVANLQNLKRELHSIQVRIGTYSVEDAKLKKIQKKRGTACAKTFSNRKTYFFRFGIPYFKTKDRFPADHNEDSKDIIKNNQIMFVRMPKVRRFLHSDIRILDRAVLEQLKTKRIRQLELRLKHLGKSEEDDSDYEQKKRNLKVAIENTKRTTDIKETQPWNMRVDFMSLSEVNTRFSYEDYERMWNLLGNPKFNRSNCSEEEFAKLRSLVEKNGAQNWEHIATALGTNRSGYMCFTNYVRSTRKGKNQPWTKEEDELLLKLCSRLNFIKKSDTPEYWRNIRRQFPNRSYSALHSHWKYVLQPTLKKGRFSAEEHENLKQLIKEGKSFSEIARIVQNRSVVQLRSHYNQIVAQATSTSQGAWSRQEEDKLVELVKKYGKTNWVAVSNEMGTRNRVQCRLKYLTLCTKEAAALLRDGTTVSMRKWSPDETALFKQLLETHGADFSRISSLMETKTAHECKLKYQRLRRTQECADMYKRTGMLKHGRWSPAERRRFDELVQKYGSQFAIISEKLGTRDVPQCEMRYAVMCRAKQRTEKQSERKLFSKKMREAKQCDEKTCNNEPNNEKEHGAQECDQKLCNENKSAAQRRGKKTCNAKLRDEQMCQEKQDEQKKCGVERRKRKCKPKQSCEDLCEATKKQDNKTKCRATRRSRKICDVERSEQSFCGAKPRITNLIQVKRISSNVDVILQTVPEGPGNQKIEYGEEHGNIVV